MTRPMSDSEICDLTDALGADLAELKETVAVLGETLDGLRNRVYALEHGTPQARQLQYEADAAMADADEFDRHGSGCGCSYCYYDPEEDAP